MSQQIYVAFVDKIPSLSLQNHEICDEVTSEEVTEMWDKLKKHCESLEAQTMPDWRSHVAGEGGYHPAPADAGSPSGEIPGTWVG